MKDSIPHKLATANHVFAAVSPGPDAAEYFPFATGHYDIKPGFIPLGEDLGNGPADAQVFQFDSTFNMYYHAKIEARTESLEKYFQTHNFSSDIAATINRFIVERLLLEHPQRFQLKHNLDGQALLSCASSDTTLSYHQNFVDLCANDTKPAFSTLFDALACQLHEDLCVVCRRPDGSDWLAAVHLCFPNHWSAANKIGRDFTQVHAPVAGIEGLNRNATALVRAMVERDPFVRFSWGLATDTRLNHHPTPPPHITPQCWTGRSFDPSKPQLFLRIERQVIWGFPKHQAALFAIRTYFTPCDTLSSNNLVALITAIQSMTPATLIYKGLVQNRDHILDWLQERLKNHENY